jgi:hypothetical protein
MIAPDRGAQQSLSVLDVAYYHRQKLLEIFRENAGLLARTEEICLPDYCRRIFLESIAVAVRAG